MSISATGSQMEHFLELTHELEEARPYARKLYIKKLLADIDIFTDSDEGLAWIYKHIDKLEQAGFFAETNWENPHALVPSLVKGTLKSGGHNTLMEICSELRILKYAAAENPNEIKGYSQEQAKDFLEQVIVHNFEFVFPDAAEEARTLSDSLYRKICLVFEFLIQHIPFQGIKENLMHELDQMAAQRPVVVDRINEILHLVKSKVELDKEKKIDKKLLEYLDARYHPTALAKQYGTVAEYDEYLHKANTDTLKKECRTMGKLMSETGLVSSYHPVLLDHAKDGKTMLKYALGLNKSGAAELDMHYEFVAQIISSIITPETAQSIYGMGRMLERNLLSHQPVLSGLKRIMELNLHPDVKDKLLKSNRTGRLENANVVLTADVIGVLGQPLGVGQGWNPTCQSARGICLWSQHAPGKLLRMIITAATENNLSFRFEGKMIQSSLLAEGLAKDFDYNLDAVSIVLVPHLDKIYFEMMRRCAIRPEDPHKWVNPAMYGHWIPTGFISAYDSATNAISNYDQFIRLFYATHHPEFNGGHDLVYPNPVGIFVTSSTGKLLGFHAVSILRVAVFEQHYRVYFLNPNNEGRQSWQEDIKPTVKGNGETYGESSLPFYQFASRLYAYHYNETDIQNEMEVPAERVERVRKLAENSWGKSYTWV